MDSKSWRGRKKTYNLWTYQPTLLQMLLGILCRAKRVAFVSSFNKVMVPYRHTIGLLLHLYVVANVIRSQSLFSDRTSYFIFPLLT